MNDEGMLHPQSGDLAEQPPGHVSAGATFNSLQQERVEVAVDEAARGFMIDPGRDAPASSRARRRLFYMNAI